jgi:hypothetical protein
MAVAGQHNRIDPPNENGLRATAGDAKADEKATNRNAV